MPVQLRVLVVDDESSMRELMEIVLAKDGYDVITVSNADDAIERLSKEAFDVVLAEAAASICLDPPAFAAIGELVKVLSRTGPIWRLIDRQGEIPEPPLPRSGHVVVVGYGRVGELVGHALSQLTIPFIVIENDLDRVRRLASAGLSAVWGDAGRHEVLDRANIPTARAVVIAVPDESTALVATASVRARNAAIPIIVRARSGGEIERFRGLGANEVVVPEYEGGLEMMRQTLVALGHDPEETLHLSHAVRDIHYQAAEHD